MNQPKIKKIYLDNSSTTVVCDEVLKKIVEVMSESYANASSLHTMGLESENQIDNAKKIISKKINCERDEIYFTSGGTESNNLAILGCTQLNRRNKGNLITTSVEHPSVMEPFEFLKRQGYNVVVIDPDLKTIKEKIYNAVDQDTVLISAMYVNNETGLRLPCEDLKKIIRQKKSSALVHVDAVQAFCKIPIDVKKMGIDLMSMSAHKIHGPKGVGALYVSNGTRIKPIMFGGGQQKSLRPGTEPVALIAGFGKAVDIDFDYEHVLNLKNYCVERLLEIKGIKINSNENCVAYILNFSLPNIKSEVLLHYLASKDIFVSSGSACSKGKRSYVLEKMGFDRKIIDSAIRVSFSRYNTMQDVDLLVNNIKKAKEDLINTKD